MKPIYALVAAAASLSAASAQQNGTAGPIRKAPTHEDILAQKQEMKRQAEEKAAATSAQQVTLQKDPSKANKPASLLSRSEVLNYNGFATLVPKRAIVHLPESLKSRTGLGKNDKIQGWQEFYLNNRGWITTLEVSQKQAEGKEPFSEETLKMMGKSSSIIVATYQGGPISVLPLQTVRAEGSTSNPESK
jgi:hypothetical protein